MSGFYSEARDRLSKELKSGEFDRYGNVMKQGVHDALLEFSRQDEEFAQAVVQGGSFEDCMKAVSQCVKGNGISDSEAYGAAVRFYFPGAAIRVEMTIDLLASVRDQADETEKSNRGLMIDLSDFF